MLVCLSSLQQNKLLTVAILLTAQEFDILNLIQEVKKHPILYAKDQKASKESREDAWNKISEELDTPRKSFDCF